MPPYPLTKFEIQKYYQNQTRLLLYWSEFHYLVRTKQSSEFQYQSTHQDLLHTPHILFYVDYL